MSGSTQNSVPLHFLVLVPGYMGSKLRDKRTGEVVWVDFNSIPKNPLQWDDWLEHLLETLKYPNQDLEPAGIMDEIIFVPPWAKHREYSRLVEALQKWGYQVDPSQPQPDKPTLYTFAYDWRQDNRESARQLGEAIERWRAAHSPSAKAWIIAHSNGGLVARWYIEKLGGKEHVGRLFLMGSPWDGAPKTMDMLFDGLEVLFRRRFNPFHIRERTRGLVRTFPSLYQLIPRCDPFLRGLNNEPVDPFVGGVWLDDPQHRQFLADGRRFNEELGTTLSVETLCFFGRKKLTTTNGVVRFGAGGRWSDIEWRATEAGDATIPERSAVHPQAKEKYPFAVDHGDIYVSPAVLEFLQWQLIDRFQEVERPERAAVVTERLTIVFEPQQDIHEPGESMGLWATIHDNEDGAPISDARVEVKLEWGKALPGAEQVEEPKDLPSARLWESEEIEGRYEGSLVAPAIEGYYRLVATVVPIGEPTVELEELIAVEAGPYREIT